MKSWPLSQRSKAWFEAAVGTPTPVQTEAWPLIRDGGSVLVSAPTGTGKTLAAFLAFLDALGEESKEGRLKDELAILYISPLKALGNDIRENLKRPLEGMRLPLRAAVRTGDTPQSQRLSMLKHPPHILITTPESLYLLLTSRSGREMLKTTRAVIIDELHALISTKRGAHLMLSLSRLDALCGRNIQRVGLSATITPLDTAAAYLDPRGAQIVAPAVRKEAEIRVISPVGDMRDLPEGSIWPEIARDIYEKSLMRRTILAFTEGRAQAEKLAYLLNQLGGDGFALTHHGCVSREQRLEAEQKLRAGRIKCLCATSSMELGIDVGDIDLVAQVGAPSAVSSEVQRLGRAGHHPGVKSEMVVYPRTAAEGLQCGLYTAAAEEGKIEKVSPPRLCLDVLSQHLVSMAAAMPYTPSDAHEIVRAAYPFREITLEDIESILRMLAGDFEHAQDKPVRARVLYDRVNGMVSGDEYTRLLALTAGGTIPDRGWYPAVLRDGTRLGELDEEFVFEARLGDKFLLGAFAWKIDEIGKDRVVVSPTNRLGAPPPFWRGDGRGRALETSLWFGKRMRELSGDADQKALAQGLQKLSLNEAAAKNTARFLASQLAASGCLPDDRTILVERFPDEAGNHQMMVHSIFGKRVNAGLALLCQRAAAGMTGLDVREYEDDDGFLLFLIGEKDIPTAALTGLDPDSAADILRAILPASPMFAMSFRYAMGRAVMLGGRTGTRRPLWVQRLRGAEALSGAVRAPEHPIIRETQRECTEDILDIDGIVAILKNIRAGLIRVREINLAAPSPMALPMRRQVEAFEMYNYSFIPQAAQESAEQAGRRLTLKPDAEALIPEKRGSADPEKLHARLMTEGDLLPEELNAPIEWAGGLKDENRALYISPGLWIAGEEKTLYESAMKGDIDSLARVTRRCLRYRGGQDAPSLSDRYQLDESLFTDILLSLVKANEAVYYEESYYHADAFEIAQRMTLRARRAETKTLPPARLCALCLRSLDAPGSPKEQVLQAVQSLRGKYFPAEQWEKELLPARVKRYRPALLDALLAEGAFFYRIREPLSVAFFPYEDEDAQAPVELSGLTGDEKAVAEALQKRGASFAHSMQAGLSAPAGEVLTALAQKGIARADSFLPVRMLLESEENASVKRRAARRATLAGTGRWELARKLKELSGDEKLDRAFALAPVLSRETCPFPGEWPEILSLLRALEYAGRVRRGYYVGGLTGSQFVSDEAYSRVTAGLAAEDKEPVWVPARDPCQLYGLSLKHEEGRAFMRVPGTAVGLVNGRVAAVFERYGERLRLFEDGEAVLSEFARAFAAGRIYPGIPRVTVKEYDKKDAEAMKKANLRDEGGVMTLWRSV